MQPEHPDLHIAYGHLYLARNEPAVPPPGQCLPNSEIFRRLAARLNLSEPSLYDSAEEMTRQVLGRDHPALSGITLEPLKDEGWVRLNQPRPFVPFAGGFPTPSGRLEFFSERAQADDFDPLPGYTPPHGAAGEGGRTSSVGYPLALIAPASHHFLNSIFANKSALRGKQGSIGIALHPDDAEARGLRSGDGARVRNDRGAFFAEVAVTEGMRPGVVASSKGFWPKVLGGGADANATVDEHDADMGGGAVFHDNRVEVERC